MASWKFVPEVVDQSAVEYTSFLGSRKFYAVDDSGSTAGSILRQQRAFVDCFEAAYANSKNAISLWGWKCDSPTKEFENIPWRSRHGGTRPSEILTNESALSTIRVCDVWFLLTDGEVPDLEVTRLASLALEEEMLNIPLVFVITGTRKESPKTTDISVGISFFASSTDTLILFKETGTGKIYVIAGKGCFASLGGSAAAQDLESWDDLQLFEDEAAFFAHCEELEIYIVQAKHRPGPAPGIALGAEWEARQNGPVRVDLDLLPKAGLLSDEDLFDLLAEEAFDTLSVAYKTRGRTAELRGFLQRQKLEQITPKLKDVAGAGSILAKMGDAKIADKQRKKLQEQLRAAHTENRQHYQNLIANLDESEEQRSLQNRNRLVDGALRALASIEAAGFSADILSRKSNRARRAEVVQEATAVEMANLDLNAPACKGFCSICCDEDAVMSICFKKPAPDKAEDNTTDFALNFPLAAGAASKNVDLISSQLICFQCAFLAPDNLSIYREPLKAVVPVLQYTDSNKKYMNEQLYLGLTAGLATGAAGISQLFMSILQELLNTKTWAGACVDETQLASSGHSDISRRRQTLEWMLNELVENTFTREDFKETGEWVKYPQALSWAAKDFQANGLASFAVTYPAAGFNSLLALATRKGAFTEDELDRLKSAKVIHSIASKYLVELQVALNSLGNDEHWKQKYLEVIYQDFNGPLIPTDKGQSSLVRDINVFTQRLSACITGIPLSTNADTMRKVQALLFWLLFKQRGHCTAQTLFTRLRTSEPLATAVLDPILPLPEPAYTALLLSIFAAQDSTLINPTAAHHHIGAVIPFANPFGATVLRCGVPDCPATFGNVDDISKLDGKTVQKIRDARTKHLIHVFGITSRFESSSTGLPERPGNGCPPSSMHYNLHISIVREWATHTHSQREIIVTDPAAQESFVKKVRERLCREGRGNIFLDTVDEDTRALMASFFEVLGRAMELQGRKGEGVWMYEHDFDANGFEEKVRWEMEAGREGLGEWELA
jgi:hypothetical protein